MRKWILAGTLMVSASFPVTASAHHESSPPKQLSSIKFIKTHDTPLYRAELRRDKPSWNHLRNIARQRWLRSHKDSRAYAYFLVRKGKVSEAVDRTMDRLHVPEWKQNAYRCIARNEGHGMADVWYGFSRGWQNGRFKGTIRVSGWFQFRPFWTPAGSRVVTKETYHYTSDPVWSTEKAVEIGFGPFFAQRGRCF